METLSVEGKYADILLALSLKVGDNGKKIWGVFVFHVVRTEKEFLEKFRDDFNSDVSNQLSPKSFPSNS